MVVGKWTGLLSGLPRMEAEIIKTESGGNLELNVSFSQMHGTWSPAINISEHPDSFRGVRFPGLSPDGRWLLFIPAGGESVYWLNAGIVEQFRPRR
jgi:hypothetical protein